MKSVQYDALAQMQNKLLSAIQERQSQPPDRSGAFRDLLNQREQALKESNASRDEVASDTPEDALVSPETTEPAEDPYRQQLAAAQAAAMVMVIPSEEPTVETLIATAPVAEAVAPPPLTAPSELTTPQQSVQAAPEQPQQTPVQTTQPQQTVPTQVQTAQPQQTVPAQVQTAEVVTTEQPIQPKPVTTERGEALQPQMTPERAAVEYRMKPVPTAEEGGQPDADTQPQTPKTELAPAKKSDGQSDAFQAATQSEAPVFQKVESAPVKVGDAPVLDTETGDVDAQLKNQVDGLLQKGGDRVVLKLNPESLGSVTVQLTRSSDGSLHVAITAGGEKAAGILEKHASGLEQLLAGNNRAPVQVEVQRGQENQQSQQHQQQDQPYDREGQAQHQEQRQQEQRTRQNVSVDFVQQLRLGLFPADDAAS